MMNAGQNQRRPIGDFEDLERFKAHKTMQSGTRLYRFPGELIDESDVEADKELEKSANGDDSSEVSWSDTSSFDSNKLIDGYKDFQAM